MGSRVMGMKDHQVELGGSSFVIRSDVDEDRIREIEAFLAEKLARIADRGRKMSFTDNLVLVLFHVTDSMLDERDASAARRGEAARAVGDLRDEMDALDEMIAERMARLENDAS